MVSLTRVSAFGKGNLFAPIQMTYLIVIESNELLQSQENHQARITEGYTNALSVTQKDQKSVMDILFSSNSTFKYSPQFKICPWSREQPSSTRARMSQCFHS